MTIVLSSPSKINLFLRVVRRRDDGFHELHSLFSAINLSDTVTITKSSSDRFQCSNASLPTDGTNLVVKAIRLFREKTNWKVPLNAFLEKRIPYEAGVGGGSGNAATALWGLSKLSGLNIDDADLMKWSGEIGSDIPFFFSNGTALCTGKGEVVEFLPELPYKKIYIVKPAFGLPTPLVYKTLDHQGLASPPHHEVVEAFFKGDFSCFNDLEKPAFFLRPELVLIKRTLLDLGFEHVLLCGSGTAFFCIGDVGMPSFPDLKIYPAAFTRREAGAWY